MEAHGYLKAKPIGEGGFAKCYLCETKDGSKRVLKEINMSTMERSKREACITEIKVIRALQHPNIVQYFDHFTTESKLYIAMEFADSGDLEQLIKRKGGLPEDVSLQYFMQICLALKYLHDQNIMHRDIKTENVFLAQGRRMVKLGDFGRSALLRGSHDLKKTQVGTPFFWSPEECQGKPYSLKSDIWALGCLLYEMVTAQLPFEHNDHNRLLGMITGGQMRPLPSSVSSELKEMITAMISRDPAARPSVGDILKLPIMRKTMSKLCTSYEKRHPEVRDLPEPDTKLRKENPSDKPLPKPEDFSGHARGQRGAGPSRPQSGGHGGMGGGHGGRGMGGHGMAGGQGNNHAKMGGAPQGGMGGMGGGMAGAAGGMAGGRMGGGAQGGHRQPSGGAHQAQKHAERPHGQHKPASAGQHGHQAKPSAPKPTQNRQAMPGHGRAHHEPEEYDLLARFEAHQRA